MQTISVPSPTQWPVAGVAQLVEHNLAKVGVAGSNPVTRFRRLCQAWFLPGKEADCTGGIAKW
jgi:hypothetical protein